MKELKGIKVELVNGNFSVIKETLERVGVVNRTTKTLYPSCYILSKRGEYYIFHFKNLFALDGKECTLSEDDNVRQSAITKLLEKWGMVKIIDKTNLIEKDNYPELFVLPYKNKKEYMIKHKYDIGIKKG